MMTDTRIRCQKKLVNKTSCEFSSRSVHPYERRPNKQRSKFDKFCNSPKWLICILLIKVATCSNHLEEELGTSVHQVYVCCKTVFTRNEIQFVVDSPNIQHPFTNSSLYQNLFHWQLFATYSHHKLYRNANNVNFMYFEKTRLVQLISKVGNIAESL